MDIVAPGLISFVNLKKLEVEGTNLKQMCRLSNINCTKLFSNESVQQIIFSEGAGKTHSLQWTVIFSTQYA